MSEATGVMGLDLIGGPDVGPLEEPARTGELRDLPDHARRIAGDDGAGRHVARDDGAGSHQRPLDGWPTEDQLAQARARLAKARAETEQANEDLKRLQAEWAGWLTDRGFSEAVRPAAS